MRKNFPIYVIITIIFVSLITNIFLYPVFYKYTNLTTKEVGEINNYHEIELYPHTEPSLLPENTPNSDTNSNDNNTNSNDNDKDSNNSTPTTVSNLNWFDTVNTTFPTYTKTRVIDIKTGLTYYVYRDGGHYHADVEPINQENTDIFYKIYNYEWSWARRPVWVEILPNMWVAGSINGYPHGNGYVKNTGMEGHTCIHFLLSKTHGTKRVDEAHQSCVKYAYDYKSEIENYL